MKVLTETEVINNFCLMYEVTDKALYKVSKDPDYYLDKEFAAEVSKMRGNNALILMINSDVPVSFIITKLHELLETYDSVSWYGREHKKFYTRRRNVVPITKV